MPLIIEKKHMAWLLIAASSLLMMTLFINCSNKPGIHSDGGATVGNPPSAQATASPTITRLTFAGIGSHGLGDPSMAQDSTSPRVWLTYSAVDPSMLWPAQIPNVVSTRLGYSDNQGLTWSDAGQTVNPSQDITLPLPSPANAGAWLSEVSQLVYDPAAATGQHYKLLWQHYLNIAGTGHFEDSWIGLKMADSPLGLAGASEIKFLTGLGYDASNNVQNGPTRSPVSGPPQIALNTSFLALSECQAFTEPGLLATPSALYMSLVCIASTDTLVVLMKCQAPCNITNSASWTYLGAVFNRAKAAALGYDGGFSGSGLFQGNDGTLYMTVTPVQNSGAPWMNYYEGCMIFPFTNIDTATVAATAKARVAGTSGSFNGACAFNKAANKAGVLYLQVQSGVPDTFRIFSSGIDF